MRIADFANSKVFLRYSCAYFTDFTIWDFLDQDLNWQPTTETSNISDYVRYITAVGYLKHQAMRRIFLNSKSFLSEITGWISSTKISVESFMFVNNSWIIYIFSIFFCTFKH